MTRSTNKTPALFDSSQMTSAQGSDSVTPKGMSKNTKKATQKKSSNSESEQNKTLVSVTNKQSEASSSSSSFGLDRAGRKILNDMLANAKSKDFPKNFSKFFIFNKLTIKSNNIHLI